MKFILMEMFCVREISNTPDDSVFGYFLQVYLRYPYKRTQKTKYFLFCPDKKLIYKGDFNENLKKLETKFFTEHKKLVFDWTDKKK